MIIRNFQPGDETGLAETYNAAASGLPGFKPASPDDIRRRARSRDFNPLDRFVALEAGTVVGYATLQPGGRVSFPWCRPGSKAQADVLFAAALSALTSRGIRRAFAAYRRDWAAQAAFFEGHGFVKVRDVVNFVQELTEMPTMVAQSSLPLTPLTADDVPGLCALVPDLWRGQSVEQVSRDLFRNPHVPAESFFGVRGRSDNRLLAAGVLVADPTFADPSAVDPWQPCFRLGAFGTEGQAHKRINGLFSFVAAPTAQSMPFALTLMSHASTVVDANDGHAVAAQCPSDQPHMLRFYQTHFRQQGYFPVFEKQL